MGGLFSRRGRHLDGAVLVAVGGVPHTSGVTGVYRIRKSIDVDFAHHVRGHAGPCIHIHGHTWKLEVDLEADELDPQGFVADFSELKANVLTPCHKLLDHSLAIGEETYADVQAELERMGQRLLASRSPAAAAQAEVPSPLRLNGAEARFPGGMKLAVFPFAPTSERLARWLFELADTKLGGGRVRVACGRVYETLHPVEAVAEFHPRGR
jgi:6-pyruvoyl tetrahydropterin synthase/QueD family protein